MTNTPNNRLSTNGYGTWLITLHDSADKELPVVSGELLVDGVKYTVTDKGSTLLVVPAGNVAFAINVDKTKYPLKNPNSK